MPCYKLAIRFDRDDMIKRFLVSGRSGFYFSVIEPGEVSAGQKIEIVKRDRRQVTVADICSLYLGTSQNPDLLERAVDTDALPRGWKAELLTRARADQT